jgi:hypothetical protein
MKGRSGAAKRASGGRNDPRGFGLLQLLITVAIIGIVSSYAIMQISNAQQAMRLSGSTRELMNYMEKARIDSIRRHAMTPAQMASISITGLRSYTIALDFNADGAIETRVIDLPQNRGVKFVTGSTILPIKITYNWRGRPTAVDGNGTALTAALILQDDAGRSSTMNLTSAGDVGITGYDATSNANVASPTISTVSTNANIRPNSQLP